MVKNFSLLFVFLFFFGSALSASAATVFLPKKPASEEREAAEELAHYWAKMTGERVDVVVEGPERVQRPRYHRFGAWRPIPRPKDPGVSFYVGETEAGRAMVSLPADLDRDGFVLRSFGDKLFLRGGSPVGTQIAAYRFLHRYGGVRWYMPTELGEHVPEWEREGLPAIDVTEEPDFLSRRLSGVNRFSGDNWEKRNLLERRYRHNHNVHRIFTEEVYEERPDFFMKRGGERVRPQEALRGDNYQICFANPDAAIFAARRAAEFFDENPEEMSYSLAMTDTRPVCQCAEFCREWIDPEKTFRDLPDYSDLVFLFMNRAAEELSKTHPDKYLGTLAYYWAENVPSFPVHPQVLPYLTADRPQWQDEAFRAEDQELMKRWAAAGPERLGVWDYYYGNSFVIPRQFSAIMGDALSYISETGITGFHGEIYSNWALDGPKAWLASQLLWDSTQDHDALLADFYRNFFQEAAGPMRAFYDRAEEIWMDQGEPVFWLKFYFDFTQMELFPPEVVAELRELLDEAEKLAESELVRDRIGLVSEGFRVTELYSRLYHGVKDLAGSSGRLGSEELIAGIKELIRLREALEAHYEEALHPNVLHRANRRFEDRARYLPGMKLNGLAAKVAHASGVNGEEDAAPSGRDGSVGCTDGLIEKIASVFPESRTAVAVAMEEAIAGGEAVDILENGDFRLDEMLHNPEEDDLFSAEYTPFGWERWGGETGRTVMALSDESAARGPLSLNARGVSKEALYQRFTVEAGGLYLLQASAKGRVSPGSRVEIQLSWFREDGGEIEEEFLYVDPLLPGDNEDWADLRVYAAAPAEARVGLASVTVHHQASGDYVFFDDVRLRKAQSRR